MHRIKRTLLPLLIVCLLLSACSAKGGYSQQTSIASASTAASVPSPAPAASSSGESVSSAISLESIPAFTDKPYIAVNNNVPGFSTSDLTTTSFESYSELDGLGRCGVAYANVCKDTMPTAERGEIGQVKPSGWHTVKYDSVDGKYLYNRCHLIGYQLTAENANPQNLITGTRYLNIEGMLPFENMVADYVKETGNHVLYRVTPIYDGNDLVATGVQMEAESVEDKGEGISFNVFCYNSQPGITIDYATGDSQLSNEPAAPQDAAASEPVGDVATSAQTSKVAVEQTYILNTNTHKFHLPTCSSVKQMSEANKKSFTGSRDTLISEGYEPCKRCNP